MLTDDDFAAIDSYIAGMRWRPLAPASQRMLLGTSIAAVGAESEQEAEKIAADARAVGLEAHVGHVHAHTANDGLIILVAVATAGWNAMTGVNALLKQVNDLSDGTKKFLAKFRGEKRRLLLHEAFDLTAVHAWLNARYGAGAWRYDPEAVRTMVAAGVFTLFVLQELNNGNRHALAVRDGAADELPAKYLPAVTE